MRLFTLLIVITGLTAAAANTDAGQNTLDDRIQKARGENRIDQRLQAMALVANDLPVTEVLDALKASDNLSSLRERLVLKDSVLKRWGQLAPAEAFAHISKMPEGLLKIEAIRSVSAAYARTNGSAAAGAALKMKPGRARTEAISIVAEHWAKSDLAAALKWANELPQGPLCEMALRSINFVWVHSDPIAASSTVQNIPSGDTKNALLMNVAENWAAIDPCAAIRWAQTLPVEAEKELAVVIAVESWANSEPRAAVEFAWKLRSGELRQRAVLAALERWATEDPQQAFEKVARSADPLQQEGVARVLAACASICPDEASQWVERLPVGPIRDGAIGAYVEAAGMWHPEAAACLAAKTADSVARAQRVEQCFRFWLACDSDAAKQWLKTSDFPEEYKRNLLSQKPSFAL